METPLASNWRKEDATSSEVVEDTVYRQFVGENFTYVFGEHTTGHIFCS